tara:strand:- start:140 stop:310 length:171 start_codon:yes stop_codon:yes gene_type:complete
MDPVVVGATGIPPNNSIVANNTSGGVIQGTQYWVAGVRRNVETWGLFFYLLGIDYT